MNTLQLEPAATYSFNGTDRPAVIAYHITGTPPEDSVIIERQVTEHSSWSVVWYCLVDGQWRRTALLDGLFETAYAALESVAFVLGNEFRTLAASTPTEGLDIEIRELRSSLTLLMAKAGGF